MRRRRSVPGALLLTMIVGCDPRPILKPIQPIPDPPQVFGQGSPIVSIPPPKTTPPSASPLALEFSVDQLDGRHHHPLRSAEEATHEQLKISMTAERTKRPKEAKPLTYVSIIAIKVLLAHRNRSAQGEFKMLREETAVQPYNSDKLTASFLPLKEEDPPSIHHLVFLAGPNQLGPDKIRARVIGTAMLLHDGVPFRETVKTLRPLPRKGIARVNHLGPGGSVIYRSEEGDTEGVIEQWFCFVRKRRAGQERPDLHCPSLNDAAK